MESVFSADVKGSVVSLYEYDELDSSFLASCFYVGIPRQKGPDRRNLWMEPYNGTAPKGGEADEELGG